MFWRLDREQKRLDEAKERWEAAGLNDYVMDIEMTYIFCQIGPSGIYRVLVMDGEATSAYPVGEPEKEAKPSPFCIGRTVDDVFSDIQDAINARWDTIHVEYDENLGYPKDMWLSNDENADTFFGWTVVNFSTDLDSFRVP